MIYTSIPQGLNTADYRLALIKAFNDINVTWTSEDYRKNIVNAVQSVKKWSHYKEAVSKAPYFDIRNLSATIYLFQHKEGLRQEDIDNIDVRLEAVYQNFIKNKDDIERKIKEEEEHEAIINDNKVAQATSRASAKKYFIEHNDAIGIIEDAIDNIIDKKEVNINAEASASYSFADKHDVKTETSNFIDEKIDEYTSLLNKEDKELFDATGLSVRVLRTIVESLEQFKGAFKMIKTIKKTSKKVKMTPAKLVKKIKTARNIENCNIVGKKPEDMIGSSIIYLYNESKRKLYRIQSIKNMGISAHGMALTNIDLEKSLIKTIRKPEEFVKMLNADSSKSSIKRIFDNIKQGKEMKTCPRINNEFIILAV